MNQNTSFRGLNSHCIYTRLYTPRTQMTHILEDLTEKISVNLPKKRSTVGSVRHIYQQSTGRCNWAMKKKYPSCFGFFLGDEILPSRVFFFRNKPWNKDFLVNQPSRFNGKISGFFRCFFRGTPMVCWKPQERLQSDVVEIVMQIVKMVVVLVWHLGGLKVVVVVVAVAALLMVNIWLTSWYALICYYLLYVSYMWGGCLGFLNHQQYVL